MKAAIQKGRAAQAQRPAKKVQSDQFRLLRQERERFLEEVQSAQHLFEKQLSSLVNAGCKREEILTFLCAAAYGYRLDETGDEWELFRMSRSGLAKLAKDARDLAKGIEQANKSLLASPAEAHARSVFSLEAPPSRDWAINDPPQGRQGLDHFAQQLPAMLRDYSRFLEKEVLSQGGISSSKSFRLSVAVEKFFVADVKRITRSEHYREIGGLLEAVEIVALPKRWGGLRRAFDATGFRMRLRQNKTPPVPGWTVPPLAREFLRSRMESGRKY